jgi:hypothetical protein
MSPENNNGRHQKMRDKVKAFLSDLQREFKSADEDPADFLDKVFRVIEAVGNEEEGDEGDLRQEPHATSGQGLSLTATGRMSAGRRDQVVREMLRLPR